MVCEKPTKYIACCMKKCNKSSQNTFSRHYKIYPTGTGDIKELLITTGSFIIIGLTNYKCLLSEYDGGKFTGVFYESVFRAYIC